MTTDSSNTHEHRQDLVTSVCMQHTFLVLINYYKTKIKIRPRTVEVKQDISVSGSTSDTIMEPPSLEYNIKAVVFEKAVQLF